MAVRIPQIDVRFQPVLSTPLGPRRALRAKNRLAMTPGMLTLVLAEGRCPSPLLRALVALDPL